MPTIALEGTGAAITFATSAFTSDLITLTLPERTREAIDTSHLGSTIVKTAKPGKLVDPGEVSAEFDHNPAAVKLIKNAAETVTITYPLETGQATAATLAFTAFVTSEGGENFTIGERMTTKVTLKVTSDFTFTAATLT
jgi:hypothetical protein